MANTKVTAAKYVEIADYLAAIWEELQVVEGNALLAVNAVVDLADDYALGIDVAREVELALLQTFNSAYLSSQNVAQTTSNYLASVRALNNQVISGSSYVGTDAAKLDDFIENECSWEGVPRGWWNLCEDAGYDTTNWGKDYSA